MVQAAKDGVRMAGGTPMEFSVIGICDGIAMNHEGMKYSLPSREIIADSIEIVAMAHAFDALVLIPNCDKIVPGMLMAAPAPQHPGHRRQRRPHAGGSAPGQGRGPHHRV